MKKNFIIAEMACSHDGDVTLAKKIINAAGEAGADAIQFQIWKAKNIMSPEHKDFPVLKKIELSFSQWQELYDYVKSTFPSMEVIACVYHPESIAFAHELGVDAYKIHCSDITNPCVIQAVAVTGKRIDLSIGGSTEREITQALSWINSSSASSVWLMYGLQHFPTPVTDISVDYMKQLSQYYGLPVGYQDHSDPETASAFWLPAAVCAQGVSIIEKHITHDRAKKGVDHQAALNPDEFIQFCKMIRQMEAVAKSSSFPRPLSGSEQQYRQYSRKSIVLAKDLPEGAEIRVEDLLFLRSERMGFVPNDIAQLIGKRLKDKMPAYSVLCDEDIA